jgi:uncharacterized cupin superfamily protein
MRKDSADVSNVWTDDWESGPEDDWSGGGGSGKRLTTHGGMLGASVYELPPGGFSVYHFHHGSEELLVVLRGRPTLRTPDGERELAEGDVVHFPAGPAGAHGLTNGTSEPVRYLMAGTRPSPEVVEYPDLGQLTAQSLHESQAGERLFVIHQLVEPPGE